MYPANSLWAQVLVVVVVDYMVFVYLTCYTERKEVEARV